MNANIKKSVGAGIALIVFGIIALFVAQRWLVVLIPAAVLVWYEATPGLHSGRN